MSLLGCATVECSSQSLTHAVKPAASGDFGKSSDCNSAARGETEKDTAVDGGWIPRLTAAVRAVQFLGPFSILHDGVFLLLPHCRVQPLEQRPRLSNCSVQTARRMECSKMPFFSFWLLISSLSSLSDGGREALLWGKGRRRTWPPLEPSRNENRCLIGSKVAVTLNAERPDGPFWKCGYDHGLLG